MTIGPTRIEEIAVPLDRLEIAPRPSRSYWQESWERVRGDRIGLFCGLVIVFLGIIAVCAPLISQYITHYGYADQDLTSLFQPPSRAHWLGTDELGRDTLTRLVYGARISLTVGFLTVALSLTVGGAIGIVAGFGRGWLDNVLMRLVDTLLAIPSIFLFILVTSLLRPNAVTLSCIIALVAWGNVSRLVRAETLSLKNREFVLATRSIGASDARIMVRHVLPNALPVVIVAASLAVGQVILIEAALSYLGLGIQPPVPSWGNMLGNAQQYFYHSVWLVVLPGLCIFVTVLCTNMFGNAVRDAFDPRLR
jgi:peptide/nickel transport system permease protein